MSSTCARILNANRHLVWSLCKCAHSCWSLENPGAKVYAAFIVNRITDLDGIAANLTILDIRLAANRCVQDHRDPFPAVRAGEEVFHEWRPGGLGVAFRMLARLLEESWPQSHSICDAVGLVAEYQALSSRHAESRHAWCGTSICTRSEAVI